MAQFQSVRVYGVIMLVLNLSFEYFQEVSRLKAPLTGVTYTAWHDSAVCQTGAVTHRYVATRKETKE